MGAEIAVWRHEFGIIDFQLVNEPWSRPCWLKSYTDCGGVRVKFSNTHLGCRVVSVGRSTIFFFVPTLNNAPALRVAENIVAKFRTLTNVVKNISTY